jgi:arylsulfatase
MATASALGLGLAAASLAAAQTQPPAPAAPRPPGFPAGPTAPAGAPNILLVMTDDVGFAASSTFGGAIPTPTFDALAAEGVRFDAFNTTALCAPTRAALLTGRNPHAVGFGTVPETAVGQPGYDAVLPKTAGTIAQVLRANGYVSAFLGKHHAVPTWETGPMGPFDHWARGLGFDYFYGFHGAWTDQFAPALIENDHPVDPPRQADYILDRDLADHAIAWLRLQRVQAKDKPFFLYYAPGTAHAPLEAPAAEIAKFHGKFDAGWDAYREEAFKRQKRLGVIPDNAKLAPLPPGVPAWSSLTPEQKTVYARYMEVYAAQLAYCDAQVGRIIEALRQSGQLANTLVVYIQGDNGASAEGGANGSISYSVRLPPEADFRLALQHLDEIGGPKTSSAMPVGWAAALDTPYPYYKAVASRLGGVRTGMVVSWPERFKARGVRSQFIDVADIAPTLYEIVGVTPPAELNGVRQQPLDGVSFADAIDNPKAPAKRHVQYFEIMGNSAVWEDGWMAATKMRANQPAGGSDADRSNPWLLFDLKADPSQTTDVAAANPDKLAHLRALFDSEAERNHVLPIQSSGYAGLAPQLRPHPAVAAGRYALYPDGWRYGEGVFPSILNRSWSVEAELTAPDGGGEGALVAQGGRFAGWGMLVLKGVPTFVYRTNILETLRLQAPTPLAAGPHRVGVAFASDGPGVGRGGEYTLSVDGQAVGHGRLEHTVAFKFPPELAAVGEDPGTPLLDDYQGPFRYDGALAQVTFDLGALQPQATSPSPAAAPK